MSRKRTEAHADPIILEEIEKFLQTAVEKIELGAVWPFHCIINTDLNIKYFPNLTICALICAVENQKQHGNETFENIVWDDRIPIMYKGIVKKALTVDIHSTPDVIASRVKVRSILINLELIKLMEMIVKQIAEVYAKELNQDEIHEIRECVETCAGELVQDEIHEIVEPEAYTEEQAEIHAEELNQEICKIVEAYTEFIQDEIREIVEPEAYAGELIQDEICEIVEAEACAGELTQDESREITEAYKRFFIQKF